MKTTTPTRQSCGDSNPDATCRTEWAELTPDATQVESGDDSHPAFTGTDEVSIVDLPEPTERELAEANFIGLLEYDLEQERRAASEAEIANNWALHQDYVENFEAREQEPAPDQQDALGH
jgi:hypothetical protein